MAKCPGYLELAGRIEDPWARPAFAALALYSAVRAAATVLAAAVAAVTLLVAVVMVMVAAVLWV
ncbi:MAG TPA: hypothetical protein VF524_15310 [Polyangia bacterium]